MTQTKFSPILQELLDHHGLEHIANNRLSWHPLFASEQLWVEFNNHFRRWEVFDRSNFDPSRTDNNPIVVAETAHPMFPRTLLDALGWQLDFVLELSSKNKGK